MNLSDSFTKQRSLLHGMKHIAVQEQICRLTSEFQDILKSSLPGILSKVVQLNSGKQKNILVPLLASRYHLNFFKEKVYSIFCGHTVKLFPADL
jgi:hypothetical protein